jgi:hypothetical protein
MTSIIKRFSLVVPSLTRRSYSEYESVHTMIGIGARPSCSVIYLMVLSIAMAISAPDVMPYISDAKTDLVTRLHFVEDQ